MRQGGFVVTFNSDHMWIMAARSPCQVSNHARRPSQAPDPNCRASHYLNVRQRINGMRELD